MSGRSHLLSVIALFAALCLTPLTPTHAAGTTTKLVTPTLQGSTLEVLACRIVNVSSTPVLVTIDVVNSFDHVIGSWSSLVAAGDTAVNEAEATGLPDGSGHCVFSGEFRKAEVRAMIELISHGKIIASAGAQ